MDIILALKLLAGAQFFAIVGPAAYRGRHGDEAGMEYGPTIGAIAVDSPTGKDLRYETLCSACSDSLKAAKRKGLFEAVVGIA